MKVEITGNTTSLVEKAWCEVNDKFMLIHISTKDKHPYYNYSGDVIRFYNEEENESCQLRFIAETELEKSHLDKSERFESIEHRYQVRVCFIRTDFKLAQIMPIEY